VHLSKGEPAMLHMLPRCVLLLFVLVISALWTALLLAARSPRSPTAPPPSESLKHLGGRLIGCCAPWHFIPTTAFDSLLTRTRWSRPFRAAGRYCSVATTTIATAIATTTAVAAVAAAVAVTTAALAFAATSLSANAVAVAATATSLSTTAVAVAVIATATSITASLASTTIATATVAASLTAAIAAATVTTATVTTVTTATVTTATVTTTITAAAVAQHQNRSYAVLHAKPTMPYPPPPQMGSLHTCTRTMQSATTTAPPTLRLHQPNLDPPTPPRMFAPTQP